MDFIHTNGELRIDHRFELVRAKSALHHFCQSQIDVWNQELLGLNPESEKLPQLTRQLLTIIAHWKQLQQFTGDLNYADENETDGVDESDLDDSASA